MVQLFVYYKVPTQHLGEVVEAALAMQVWLTRQYPGLGCELLRQRSAPENSMGSPRATTLMEIYRLYDGIDAGLADVIDAAAKKWIGSRIDSRHREFFETITAPRKVV